MLNYYESVWNQVHGTDQCKSDILFTKLQSKIKENFTD